MLQLAGTQESGIESRYSATSRDDSKLGGAERAYGCLLCHGLTRRLFTKHGYWIRGCDSCGHRLTEIRPSAGHVDSVYDSGYFRGGGSGYPDYLGEAKILRRHGQRYGRLLARHMRPGTVLDVGSAAGFVLQGLQDSGWRGMGIEPNQAMVDHGRKLGLQVHNGSLEHFQSTDRFDLISMVQVVAHFTDPHKAFQVATELTRPCGFWLIETWNIDSWSARVFGNQWHEYSPPSTLNYFSPEGLRKLAGQYGFREIARGRPMKWINGAHAKSLVRYKLQGSMLGRFVLGITSLIPDRISLPYPSEDLFWTLFQKQ